MNHRSPLTGHAGLSAGSVLIVLTAVTLAATSAKSPRAQTHPKGDAFSRLQTRLASGEVKLKYEGELGYLRSLLSALDVPVSSQLLVFSKTSVQKKHISPETPRSLYFNDCVYVGRTPGASTLELSAVDPVNGAVFYSLEQDAAKPPNISKFTTECFVCHNAALTGKVPGFIMRSIYAAADGGPALAEESYLTTDRSPFEQRWGGWYVTGRSGAQVHMGNSIMDVDGKFDRKAGSNVTELAGRLDTSHYPVPTSDIVALMVLGHQTSVQNQIIKASHMLRPEADAPARNSEDRAARIKAACEPLIQALLFSGGIPLTEPVVGTSTFAYDFSRRGLRDRRGRSLRDFDLKTRIFRYPCSYLIYSDSVMALPEPAKRYLVRRIRQILSGADRSPEFAHLSSEDRSAILEILRDTHPLFRPAQAITAVRP